MEGRTTTESLISQFTHLKVAPPQSPPPYDQHEPDLYITSPSNADSLTGSITPTPDIAPVAESTQLENLYPSPNSPILPDQLPKPQFPTAESRRDGSTPGTLSPSTARRTRTGSDKRSNRIGGEGVGTTWSSIVPNLTIQTSLEYFQQPPVYKQHPPSAPPLLMDPATIG
ncbi:hypothetical protein HK097_011049, partial [Rhizophlyctis rosea]